MILQMTLKSIAVHVIVRRDSGREFQMVSPETERSLPELSPGSRHEHIITTTTVIIVIIILLLTIEAGHSS